MGYFATRGGYLLWVIVWRVLVIFMHYYVGSGDNMLWVIVWRVVVNNGLFFDEWW